MSNLVVGIDWGTTNSCVSYYDTYSKKVIVIPNEQGSYTTPTILFLNKDSSEILYGEPALNLLNSNNNSIFLSNIFSNIKRLVGNKHIPFDALKLFKQNNLNENDLTFDVMFDNKTQNINVSSLIILYLSYLKKIIYNYLSLNIDSTILDIVITVPAYFDDNQRTILKECCETINLNVLRIINEPTAASLAYAFDKPNNKSLLNEYILTFDSGGGTTDISLLYMDYTDQLYEVKNTVGDNFLGGEDITNNIVEFIINKLKLKDEELCLNEKIRNKIKNEAEKCKKHLSFNSNYNIYLELNNKDYSINISQTQFNDINKSFFAKIKNLIYYLLDDYMAKTKHVFNYDLINSIIFVGATTRIPYFIKLFQEILPNAQINNTIDPDQTISIGGSIQGALLKNIIDENDDRSNMLLMDIIPLSIGVETLGGIMGVVISRNNLIPISRTKHFTNSVGYEDTISINIYQGERRFVSDNTHLGSFELQCDLFKKYDKGEINISITFDIDSNSIINAIACAKINDTSIKSEIQVTKNLNQTISSNIENILYYSEMNKLIDSEESNKILAKLELYDSFKYLLSVFHTHKENDDNNDILNELFNNTFNVIQDYNQYTSNELINIKQKFESSWHSILFGGKILLKDTEGLIIEFGGTNLI